jgi:hypothetical protein
MSKIFGTAKSQNDPKEDMIISWNGEPTPSSTLFLNPQLRGQGNPTDPTNPANGLQNYVIVAPFNGQLRNMRAQADQLASSGQSLTISAQVAGSTSTLVAVLGNASTSAADTTHIVNVAAGELICFKAVATGTYAGTEVTVAMEFAKTN